MSRRRLHSWTREYGWVIYSERRGGYVCESDATSAGRMVGLTQDVSEATFFGSHEAEQAERTAYWQLGQARPAIRYTVQKKSKIGTKILLR